MNFILSDIKQNEVLTLYTWYSWYSTVVEIMKNSSNKFLTCAVVTAAACCAAMKERIYLKYSWDSKLKIGGQQTGNIVMSQINNTPLNIC